MDQELSSEDLREIQEMFGVKLREPCGSVPEGCQGFSVFDGEGDSFGDVVSDGPFFNKEGLQVAIRERLADPEQTDDWL